MNKLRKFWSWLWTSKSILSWVVLFIIAFVVIKFIFFPVLGLMLNSELPAVIVESGSMEHKGIFDNWWPSQENLYSDFSISKEDFLKFPFKNGFDKGDIIIVKGFKDKNYSIGDVIVFRVYEQSTPLIHRIVKIKESNSGLRYSTKGDHNSDQLEFEKEIMPEQIVGKAIGVIPKLGWLKLIFVGKF